MANRFDVETNIMDAWNIVSDIDALYHHLGTREVPEDELQNALLGLSAMGQIKFERLFNTFEALIAERKI